MKDIRMCRLVEEGEHQDFQEFVAEICIILYSNFLFHVYWFIMIKERTRGP